MEKQLIKFLGSILTIIFLAFPTNTLASKKNSFSFPKSTTSYKPKAPYAGYGKPSESTGKLKTKPVKGYFKPSNGYKFVNPYARSK